MAASRTPAQPAAAPASAQPAPPAPATDASADPSSPGWTPRSRPAAGTTARVRDDLKRIKGIGPVLEKWLHGKGITTFVQIANLTQVEVDAMETEQSFPNRFDREDWKGQAARFAAEAN